MMKPGPVKFAVVREDPSVESAVVERLGARRVLLVASGGCTALTLLARHQGLHATAFDFNPAQVALVEEKRAVIGRGVPVPREVVERLSQHGQFESLFRSLRAFLLEFVTDADTLERLCGPLEHAERARLAAAVTTHAYWPVAFQLFFSDALLHAMFGPAATQHAEPGSYPGYFRALFERALVDARTAENPWMHHVLLGRYRDDVGLPHWSEAPREGTLLTLVNGTLDKVPADVPHDVVSLSNLCDWMTPAEVHALGAEALERVRPGGAIIIRQLNNARPLEDAFPGVAWDEAWSRALHQRERSLFYGRVRVGFRT